ncbi:MAG TPA: hypothetical protein VGN11_10145, partial [Candidatus Baltobacteraceae bacterium]|nr:hypothetical protein [Candidatus Baltobacteraceae bacterium]
DVLIELFDREFIEPQETLGMSVLGQFRVLDDPNRFFWLRGFADMPSRAQGLSAFYGGPIWKAHRDTANATMIDSDNVLLLRPARPQSGFEMRGAGRPQSGGAPSKKLFLATIYYFDAAAGDAFVDFFERVMKPELTENGASVLGYFVTENSPNNFPPLPVRENEHVFFSLVSFPDSQAYERHLAALAQSATWQTAVANMLERRLKARPEIWRLTPTSRSTLQ